MGVVLRNYSPWVQFSRRGIELSYHINGGMLYGMAYGVVVCNAKIGEAGLLWICDWPFPWDFGWCKIPVAVETAPFSNVFFLAQKGFRRSMSDFFSRQIPVRWCWTSVSLLQLASKILCHPQRIELFLFHCGGSYSLLRGWKNTTPYSHRTRMVLLYLQIFKKHIC